MAQPPLGAPQTPPGGLGALGPQGGAVGCYPPAKATHDAVKNDRSLFIRLLRKLHEDLGTQFRTPTVSGKELDLHMLYQQVTHHGGLEHVVTGKKWTEVSQPFKFPPSFTSKSFTLRKMYSRLLHDFEQVYYLNNTGPPVVPYGADGTKIEGGAAMSSTNPLYRRRRMEVQTAMSQNPYASPQMPHPILSAFLQGPNAPQGSLVGQAVSGRVEAQFDCGFFVNLSVGGHDYLGVLYNPPQHLVGGQLPGLGSGSGMSLQAQQQQQQQHMQVTPLQPPPGHPQMGPQGPHGMQPQFGFYPASPEGGGAVGGGGYYPYPNTPAVHPSKRQKTARDPNQPKQNKTPFNFFSVDARVEAKAKFPAASQKEISKVVGEMWSKTTDEQKEKYVKMAQEDKERYQKALENFQMLKRESSLENVGPSSWPQGSGLASVPSLTLTRTQLEDVGSAAQQLQMHQQQQQQMALMPPQGHMGAHSAPPTPLLHPAFSAPGHGVMGFPSASQAYQARQPRFTGMPGGTGEEHEDAALSMREMMLQGSEGAGNLTALRQMDMQRQHQQQQQQQQHHQLAAPYGLERTQLPMNPMLHSVHMPSSHQRGPHNLQEGTYEEVETAEQEEYEDEGSEQE